MGWIDEMKARDGGIDGNTSLIMFSSGDTRSRALSMRAESFFATSASVSSPVSGSGVCGGFSEAFSCAFDTSEMLLSSFLPEVDIVLVVVEA